MFLVTTKQSLVSNKLLDELGPGSGDENTSDHHIDVSTNGGCSDVGADSCPADEDDDDINHHQCLQCDKSFGDYDT